MLKQRAITASILAILVLSGIFFAPPNVFLGVVTALVLVAAWEWAALCGFNAYWQKMTYLISLLLACVFCHFYLPISILYLSLFWWVCAILLVLFYPKTQALFNPKSMRALMGFVTLTPWWIALSIFKFIPNGPAYLVYVLFLVWSADVGAYFAGRQFGKHKLAPNVSPGKTWEGSVGGVILSLFIVLIGGLLLKITGLHAWLYLIGLSLVTVIVSIFGDLFESILKRVCGVKDSGTILPGHGGFLDRIDSLTAALPIFLFGLLVTL